MVEQSNLARFANFHQYSVNALLNMGYSENKVFDVLTHLKQQKNYTPVGEIDKAIDLLTK